MPVRRGEGFLKLRPGFAGIFGGDSCAALLFDLFVYWTDSGHYDGGYFQKTINEFQQDLLATYGEQKIRTALGRPSDAGLVEWVKAGKLRSASSFRLNPDAVNEALDDWELRTRSSKRRTRSSDSWAQSSKSRTDNVGVYKEPRAFRRAEYT